MKDILEARIAFISSVFGPGAVNKQAISVNCPSCGKGNPDKKKLVIRLENGMHHCWVCGLKGRTLKYTLQKYFPYSYAKYQNLFEDSNNKITFNEGELEVEISLPKDFLFLAQNLNSSDPDVRSTISYAKSRGLKLKDFWYFKLGTCSIGRFRRRLIMPSFDVDGNLNYFTARSIDSDTTRKYLNAKAPKKNLIFNEINVCWSRELTLVEGPMDIVKCDSNVVPLLGSSLNEGYLLFKKIVKNSTPVLMALDPDAKDKIQTLCYKLYSYGISIRQLDFEDYKDVGEMSKKEFLRRKGLATSWEPNHRILHMISKIKSGSLL